MLYFKKRITDNTVVGVWKVEETIEELLSILVNKDWLEIVFCANSDARKREMLATRVLLKELLGEEKEICYFKSGKPYLSDESYNVSISHTRGYVAVVLDKYDTVGLDIEQCTDKILRVRDRVITRYDYIDEEQAQVHLLLHWSAKEAMFKYLNAEGVDFRRNLHVEPFVPQGRGVFDVSESKTMERQQFGAHYMVTADFVLVCLVKKILES